MVSRSSSNSWTSRLQQYTAPPRKQLSKCIDRIRVVCQADRNTRAASCAHEFSSDGQSEHFSALLQSLPFTLAPPTLLRCYGLRTCSIGSWLDAATQKQSLSLATSGVLCARKDELHYLDTVPAPQLSASHLLASRDYTDRRHAQDKSHVLFRATLRLRL